MWFKSEYSGVASKGSGFFALGLCIALLFFCLMGWKVLDMFSFDCEDFWRSTDFFLWFWDELYWLFIWLILVFKFAWMGKTTLVFTGCMLKIETEGAFYSTFFSVNGLLERAKWSVLSLEMFLFLVELNSCCLLFAEFSSCNLLFAELCLFCAWTKEVYDFSILFCFCLSISPS